MISQDEFSPIDEEFSHYPMVQQRIDPPRPREPPVVPLNEKLGALNEQYQNLVGQMVCE